MLKNRFIYFIQIFCLLTLVAFMSSCKKKYPEDEFGHFKSPENRIFKKWRLKKYLVNDVANAKFDGTYFKETFSILNENEKSGIFTDECLLYSPSISYEFHFTSDESGFEFREVGNAYYVPTTIRKLTRKELWYTYNLAGNKYEWQFEKE